MKLRPALVATLFVLASAAPALAADHLMKVGEVMLSNQGSTTSQFIELEDPFNEPFPNAPYSLQLFDAAGASLGSVALTIPANTRRLLIATAAAATQFSVTAQATLTVTLPPNGQACFNNLSAHIHCLAWGTVTSNVIGLSGNDTVVAPPDGMSIQRVGTSYNLDTPSPGAVNTAVPPDSSAADAGVDAAPPPPDAPSGSPDAPTGNPNNGGGGGCSVGSGAALPWFADRKSVV